MNRQERRANAAQSRKDGSLFQLPLRIGVDFSAMLGRETALQLAKEVVDTVLADNRYVAIRSGQHSHSVTVDTPDGSTLELIVTFDLRRKLLGVGFPSDFVQAANEEEYAAHCDALPQVTL